MKELQILLLKCPDEIKDNLVELNLDEKTTFMFQGAEPKYVFFLLEGRVNIYRLSPNGINYLEYTYTDMEMIGEVEAVNGKECLSNVMTEKTSRLLRIEVKNFKKWMKLDPAFNQYVMRELANKLYLASLHSEVNITFPMRYKVLHFIQTRVKEGIRYIRKDELNTAVAGKMRSTNRILNDLVEEGYIEADVGMIRVLDSESIDKEIMKFER